MRYAAILFFLFVAPAVAQGVPGQRASDQVFSAEMIAQLIVGQTHEFFDGGQSFFSISGTYTYTYPDGGVAYGDYEVRDAGAVCTFFSHGFERCDTYVLAGDRIVLITQAGQRFPVRETF